MSDHHSKRWLADDPKFLVSLGDLDRGLLDDQQPLEDESGDQTPDAAAPPPPPPPNRPAPVTPSAAARATRPIDAARALDLTRVLDTAPSAPALPPARVRAVPVAADSLGEGDGQGPPPPLAFNRPAIAAPRSRGPLVDLFPSSLLEPERPPLLERGTAVAAPLPPRSRVASQSPPGEAPPQLDALTYETFYGLHEKPFSLSTDPRFHYQSGSHERAGDEILAAIGTRGGPVVLTAPLGMGKTTLCLSLLPEIDRRTVTSVVREPIQSIDDLLKTMLVDFGVITGDELARAPQVAREMLTSTLLSFLESLAGLNAGAVLFLDEAQNVPVAVLGDLAIVMGTPKARALQLVLVGQPALTMVLKHDDLGALNASVSRRIELGPLAADEVASYVTHRLSIAGANTRVEFDEAAIARLYELSAGSPRIVNLLCDHALTRGHAAAAAVVDVALVDASAEDLDLELPEGEQRGMLVSLAIVLFFALLVAAGAAGALWVWRDAVGRTIEQWEQMPQPPGGPLRRLPVPLAPISPPAATPDNLQGDPAI